MKEILRLRLSHIYNIFGMISTGLGGIGLACCFGYSSQENVECVQDKSVFFALVFVHIYQTELFGNQLRITPGYGGLLQQIWHTTLNHKNLS